MRVKQIKIEILMNRIYIMCSLFWSVNFEILLMDEDNDMVDYLISVYSTCD